MPSPRAFLIDGTAFCYRAFYAIRNLSTSDGRPTNAVYGFAMMLKALREKERPDYLAVAFDAGKPTFRHQKFKDYKVQRKPMPEPLIGQLPVVKRMLAAYRIPLFEREGYEGEDLLATIAKQLAANGVEAFLVTGDKDVLQLVNSHIKVYNPHKEDAVLDAAAVRTRYGVEPAQMVDLMALMGDEIDNIPGVPGIGEKTATELLQRFGSLEGVYQHLDEIESRERRRHLEASRRQVELSRELAQVHTDVPVEVKVEDLAVHEPDWRSLRALFRELEFKRLLRDVEAQAPAVPGQKIVAHLIEDTQDLKPLLSKLPRHGSRHPVAVLCWPAPSSKADGLLFALARDEQEAWVVPVTSETFRSAAGRKLREWLADPETPKVSHDAKAAKRMLARAGAELQGIVGDTMLAAYLLNPSRTNQTLSDLSDEYLDEPLGPMPPPQQLPPQRSLVHGDSLEPFARCACTVLRLHEFLRCRLDAQGMTALYTELELPLLGVLSQMEQTGIAVDVAFLKGLHASMETELARLIQEIYRLAGGDFNLNSPKQLAQVLFERLKLPVVKRNKTGPSTDSDVLQQLAERHPLPARLMHYRELSKLVSTYVAALPKLIDPKTGRLHTSFNQTATATGRLSSSDPNLQNIPIKTELGRSIRKAFVPGIPDGVFLAADYSEIELRILAHLSADERLIDAFRHDRDIHRFTASLIYGCPESEVQPEQRQAMKAVNYGLLYGMTSHGLSKELGISFEEAQAFIDAYFERYPKVREYLDSQIAQAKRNGFVQTLLGRRRYIPEVNSPNPIIRQFGERMAVNAPVQGTAADLIKRAMVQLASALDEHQLRSRMVLQVHDELVFEVPRRELKTLVALARRIMEGAIALSVPLTVTVKAGPNWLDLSEVKN